MVDDAEIELAELKGFTRALALFTILSWGVFLFILGYVLYKINTLPDKIVSELNEQLNFTPVK